MWLKHPRTGKPDTMLSAAMAGFVLCSIFTVGAFVTAIIFNDTNFLKYVATIDAAILTPTVAAYTARKYSDVRHGNGHNKEEEKKDA